MTTTVRAATGADAAFVAWTILAASRSHLPRGGWDLSLALPEDGCLDVLARVVQAMPATFCGLGGFLIAEVDGRPAAALSAYDPGLVAPIDAAVDGVLTGMGWTAADIEASNTRLAPVLTCVATQRPGTWIVEWVAARPEYRRRGLVDRLLADVLALGRTRGYRDAQIAHLIGNTPAERAYEKAGFRTTLRHTHPDFEAAMGSPGVAEMHLAL